jgi:hypothetical protein
MKWLLKLNKIPTTQKETQEKKKSIKTTLAY